MTTSAPISRAMALRLAMVSLVVILAAFLVNQAIGYTRDIFLLSSGSIGDFLLRFWQYMSISVLPVLVFFVIVLFVLALRIERPLRSLEEKQTTGSVGREGVVKRMLQYRRVVVVLNILGFALGHVLDFILNGTLVELFQFDNLVLLVRNVASGYVYAAIQLGFIDHMLEPARLRLKFHQFPEGAKAGSIGTSLLVLVVITVVYATSSINVGMTSVYRQEAIYSETSRAVVEGRLSAAEAEQSYREQIRDVVMESTSRGVVEAEDVPYPDDAAGMAYRVRAYRISTTMYALFVVLVALLSQYLASRNLRRALMSISDQVETLSSGEADLTTRVALLNTDEIGNIASNLNAFLKMLQALMWRVRDAATMAAGSSEQLMGAVSEGKVAVDELLGAAEKVQSDAHKQMDDAESTTSVFAAMANGLDEIGTQAEAQASFVEQTSSAIEEMTASIQSVSERARETNSLSGHLKELTSVGRTTVDRTATAMNDISVANEQTNSILKTISVIAAQTNLLSMNAAIEAAHAGKHGAGFAVVAQEIRTLASNSGERAREIRDIVKGMNERIQNGTERAAETQEALGSVEQEVDRSEALVAQISQAMEEQAAGTDEILSAVSSMVAGVESIRDRIEEQRKESDRLRAAIDHLLELSKGVEESGNTERELARRVGELVDNMVERAKSDGENAKGLMQAVEKLKLG